MDKTHNQLNIIIGNIHFLKAMYPIVAMECIGLIKIRSCPGVYNHCNCYVSTHYCFQHWVVITDGDCRKRHVGLMFDLY